MGIHNRYISRAQRRMHTRSGRSTRRNSIVNNAFCSSAVARPQHTHTHKVCVPRILKCNFNMLFIFNSSFALHTLISVDEMMCFCCFSLLSLGIGALLHRVFDARALARTDAFFSNDRFVVLLNSLCYRTSVCSPPHCSSRSLTQNEK